MQLDIVDVSNGGSNYVGGETHIMSIEASLSVVLKANEVVVAQSTDPLLWQNTLLAINTGGHAAPSSLNTAPGVPISTVPSAPTSSALSQFASQLALDIAQLVGACDPQSEAPYLHLDFHCWEEMKKQLPRSGAVSLPLLAVPATLLVLWMKKAELGTATQAQAQAVLATISARDKNDSRSIQNTSWLQGRSGGQILLNPAEISKAIKVAKCFCSKDWSSWKNPEG